MKKLSFGMLNMAAVAGAVMMFAASASADEMVRYNARPGSKVQIAGTSTIHDWTMEGSIIGGYMEFPKGVVLDSTQAAPAGLKAGKVDAHVEASIPVRSVKSGKSGMDEVMQQAMDEKNSPKIVYHLTEMTFKEPHAAGTPLQFDTKGQLAVHGVTNTISLPVTIENADKGKVKVVGTIPLKMTDYKVTPPAPSIGLGLIKTGDEVKISFEWLVAQPAETK
jgi:polyisoprenoid-binding protein YceI